ncbi:DeoR/GlpR family DNA-binding transcription regulator [Enterococcus sp. LJL90]
MYQEQRLVRILELLEKQEELSTNELMELFDVSKDTIRRDVALLAEKGQLKRIHGGIIRKNGGNEMAGFQERLQDFTESKRYIAKLANSFIEDNGTYFFDVSTIVLKLAQLVTQKSKIYSHSLDNAILLSGKQNVSFHLIGGKFYPENRFYYSLKETQLLENMRFDLAFIGAAGLKDGLVSYQDEEDARVKQLILAQAKKKVLLAEGSKFEKMSTYSIGSINQFDYLITDKKPNAAQQALLTPQLKIIY